MKRLEGIKGFEAFKKVAQPFISKLVIAIGTIATMIILIILSVFIFIDQAVKKEKHNSNSYHIHRIFVL